MISKRKVIGAAVLSIALAGISWVASAQSAKAKLTASDYAEIQELFANYTQALDMGQPERLAGVFTTDGELIGSRGPGQANAVRTPTKGTEELLQMERNHGNFGSRHLTSNLVIKQTAEGVKATTYLIDINVSTTPATVAFTGLFDAIVEKTAAGWRLKKLVVWRDEDDITPFKATSIQGQGKKKQ